MTSKLPTRKVGTTQVSAIGYGAMGISSFYGAAAPDEERFKVTSTLRYNIPHTTLSDARRRLRGRLHQLGHC